MQKFFKTEEKRPFSYPTIVEHRKNNDYKPWIAGIILIVVFFLIGYFLLK